MSDERRRSRRPGVHRHAGLAILTLLASVFLVHLAQAHSVSISPGDCRQHGGEVEVTAIFSRAELRASLPALAGGAHGDEPLGESAARAVEDWVRTGWRATSAGRPCTASDPAVEATEQDGVGARIAATLGGRARPRLVVGARGEGAQHSHRRHRCAVVRRPRRARMTHSFGTCTVLLIMRLPESANTRTSG